MLHVAVEVTFAVVAIASGFVIGFSIRGVICRWEREEEQPPYDLSMIHYATCGACGQSVPLMDDHWTLSPHSCI